MVPYENGLKWMGSLKRWPLIRAAGERTAWTAQSDLQPPDRRRQLVWLAMACMAYPFGESLPFIGLLFVSCSLVGILAVRLHQVRQEAERVAAELRVKSAQFPADPGNYFSSERLVPVGLLDDLNRADDSRVIGKLIREIASESRL